jgi:hypothetical protein
MRAFLFLNSLPMLDFKLVLGVIKNRNHVNKFKLMIIKWVFTKLFARYSLILKKEFLEWRVDIGTNENLSRRDLHNYILRFYIHTPFWGLLLKYNVIRKL